MKNMFTVPLAHPNHQQFEHSESILVLLENVPMFDTFLCACKSHDPAAIPQVHALLFTAAMWLEHGNGLSLYP